MSTSNKPEMTTAQRLLHNSALSSRTILFLLFFLSGLSALVYEVLWLKELGLLFGNTSYAAATTLAAFFAGLSVGGAFWGERSRKIKNPLLVYSALEFGIAISALLYLLVSHEYALAYPTFFTIFENHSGIFLLAKFVMASTLLFLPAFFMGGTFPIIGQQLIKREESLGTTGTLLYAVNTLGAVVGAFIAGFYLPITLGYMNSYMMAVSLNAAIAIVSFALSRAVTEKAPAVQPSGDSSDYHYAGEDNVFLKPSLGLSIAFLSGLASLCLEVLWTDMFKQVTQNTVYSFSIVLVAFLLALGVGSFVAHILCRVKMRPFAILFALLALSGLLVNLSPLAFFRLTNGLEEIFLSSDWQHYNLSVFTIAAVVILLPGIAVGTILPYLLKTSSARNMGAGKIIGRLISINTLGAILGSLGAGFLLIPYIGLWQSVKLVAGMYIIMALFVTDRFTTRRFVFRAVTCAGLIFISSLFFSSSHPVVNADSKEEVVLDTWQGSYGTVAVLRKGKDLGIKVNNHYSIGSTAGVLAEQMQTQIPLLLHPNPKDVFFIGMGTGITAGAAMKFPVQHVEICELIPEIVEASRKYFGPYTNNMFTDPRTSLIVDDGRNYLLGSKKKYDVIIQDFLNPWDAGTGSLYSTEHYRSVQSHLKQGGIFAQWVALFQVSKQEFSIMARTMLDVFPEVTLWRLPSPPYHQLVGLIGYNEKVPLDNAQLRRNVESLFSKADHGMPDYFADEIPYIFYLGNLTSHRAMFENYPINTEDYPLIEYLTPITLQKIRSGIVKPFSGLQFGKFYEKLLETLPPEKDYYLKNLNDKQYRYVYAELYSFKTILSQRAGMSKEAQENYRRFLFYYPGKYSGIKH